MTETKPIAVRRKKKSRLKWIIGGLVLLIVVLVAFGRGGDRGTSVAIEKAAPHTIIETVTASGSIYPETEVKIAPEVSGEVTELAVAEGDSVQRGQLLLRINAALYNSMVNQAAASVNQSEAGVANSRQMSEQARSRYELALANYNRNKDLLNKKYISQQEFDQFETEYRSARATYDAARASTSGGQYGVAGAQAGLSQAQENLRKTTILAPTSGIISQLNVKRGERVVGTAQMAGTELLTIADMNRIEVRVDVSENDIAKVKIGDTASVEASAYSGRKFTGIVTRVGVSSKSGSSLTGGSTSSDQVSNYTVRILILPQSYADLAARMQRGQFVFKPGMSAFVEIATRKESNVLSVPINAVTTRDWADTSKTRLRAAGNSNAVRQVVFVYNAATKEVVVRDVTTGVQDNEFIQITSGLRAGDEVIAAPYGTITRVLKDKMKVRVVQKDALFEEKEEK